MNKDIKLAYIRDAAKISRDWAKKYPEDAAKWLKHAKNMEEWLAELEAA